MCLCKSACYKNHWTFNIDTSSADILGVYSGGGCDGTSLYGAVGVVVQSSGW